ncbi:MAG TPA: ATP-binding protein [Acidobacteriaceae bacterium]|nr:ATP-binding protein [Acidobacteriaceae bacterium]
MRLRGAPRSFGGVIVTAVLLFAALVGALALWPNRSYRLPWQDSFASGDIDGWQAFGGAWSPYKGGIRNNSDERGAKFITGSPAWSDYAVDADVSLLGEDGDAGIIVRSSDEEEGVDSYSGYYVGLRDSNNSLTIGRADHGWAEYQAVSPRERLLPSHWYHLHIVAVGCSIAAVASSGTPGDRTWVAMYEPSCARSGRIGLRSYSSGGLWKNIRVSRAGSGELNPLLAQAPPQPKPGFLQSEAGFNSLRLNQPGISSQFTENLHQAATAPLAPIGQLSGLSAGQPVTVAIRGSVTLISPRVYVQDATGGATVEFLHAPSLKIGDEVQIAGEVEPSHFSAALHKATGHVLWQRSPAPPISVSATQAAVGLYDARFIETEAEVDGVRDSAGGQIELLLHSGYQHFVSIVDSQANPSPLRNIRPHSRVRVRGVCVVDPAFTGNAAGFAILLRSSSDVHVLAGPPWWALRNLLAAGMALPVVALLGLFVYSRAEHWRMRAVLDERLRMAREVHDTLAQGYAAIAFQLESAIDREGRISTPESVTRALQMAERSRGEAHLSIASLRALHAEARFSELLRRLLAVQIASGITLAIRSYGTERRLPVEIESNLLRIIQECVANTVRHAKAALVQVELHYAPELLSVTVSDDGTGFDPDAAPGTEEGHYGLAGMRERSARIGADFQLTSAPAGTCIRVRVPLPRSRSVAWGYTLSLFRRTLRRLGGLRLAAFGRSEQMDAKDNPRFDLR